MVYYIAGGSVYNASSYKVYAYADHDGYPDVEYGARTDADMGTGDCYWRLGGTGGQQVAEIGLNDSYRIRISSSGIEGYSEDATGWVDLLAGGGGGASQLSDLTDVNLVSYTDGFVLRADGVDFEAGYLQWGDIDSKPSSFTPSSHALPVSGGYHSGELALIDLGSYVRGSLIRGGATDWEALAKGTENYVLKAGATDINWGQVAYSELTGVPSTFTPIQHGIASSTYHSSSATVGQMLKADANGLPVNATNTDAQVSATVTASHARSHAITGSSDHTMTANRILYSSNTAVITELALGSANYYLKSQGATSVPIFAQIQHGELGGVGTSDHHVKYTDGEVDARIALANHDTLLNPNGNADEQHLTAAQVTALHARQHAINSASDHTGYGDLVTKNEASIDHDALTNFVANEHVNHADKITETSDTFPADPTNGQIHRDTVDESLYRYNSTAGAWIEIGAGGLFSSSNVSDDVYAAGWDGVTAIAPSKNAVYDKIEALDAADLLGVKTLNSPTRSTTSATYLKLKEILIQVSGTITFYWQASTLVLEYLYAYTRLYVNGVAIGAEKSCGFIYEDESDSISVSAGDLVQVYGKRSADGGSVYVKNFYVNTFGNINWDY